MTPAIPPLASEACAELAQKYATLGELRRSRARGEPLPERGVFRALARRFPGCLNELDTLPLAEIDERAAALQHAAEGGPREPWMAWIWDYHRLLREAFALRLASRRSASASTDEPVRDVTARPSGRVVPVVLARLSELHATPVEEIGRAIFARRRRHAPAPR